MDKKSAVAIGQMKKILEENGRYTCQYCGGQFVFEPKDSLPNVVEKMQDDMVDALNSLEYDEAEAYSQRLLCIAPENGMAWTVAGLIEIGKYITYENAERLLEDFEKAVEYAKGDDYDNIMEVVKDHIERFDRNIIDARPDLEERVKHLEEKVKDARVFIVKCAHNVL